MADSYFKYPRTAGVKIDYEKTDGTILDTSLPMNERYPTIFPKEDDSEGEFLFWKPA